MKSRLIRLAQTLLPVVLFACSLHSQTQTPAITGIAHIAFRVSNLDKSLDFFKKLGFEQSFAMTAGGKTTQVFFKINDRQFIEVYPQTDNSQPIGWMHVCYESDSLNALVAAYIARGLKPTPVVKAAAGNLISTLRGPDGGLSEFTQYMPGSRHTLDRGQHLGEHRVSQQLLGFELPVANLAAEKQFYTTGLGFEADEGTTEVRLGIESDPDLRIELRTANTGDRPEFIFAVPDAAQAAQQLQAQGIAAKRLKKLVIVNDPDGNVFVFAEVSAH